MDKLHTFWENFWTEKVWLPPNETWANIVPKINKTNGEILHTNPKDLMLPIFIGVLLVGLRFLFEKFWFAPIGRSLGIKNIKPKMAPKNDILEDFYIKNSKKWKFKQIQYLAKKLDYTERQIERWLRMRKNQQKPSVLTKFCENFWRFSYYIISFTYGLIILWKKPWLWNINECWTNYPHQPVTFDIWFYYIISMSFYWSLIYTQFRDVKRRDFWPMFLHHVATLLLCTLSWIVQVFRIGSLVLLIHDLADIFVEAGKMAKYSNYQKLYDGLFAVFTVVWFITRLVLFPFWILKNTLFDAPKLVPIFPAYYIFNFLLVLLLGLHIMWTVYIVKMAVNSIINGRMEGDIRSSGEELNENSDTEQHHVN